jgi:hypothetical protein
LGDTAWVTIVGVAKNTVREQWSSPAEEEVFPFAQVRGFLTDAGSHYGYLSSWRVRLHGRDR